MTRFIPDHAPMALTDEFGLDNMKRVQWDAFVRKNGIEKRVPEFLEMLSLLREFLLPVMQAASDKGGLPGYWKACGQWSSGRET